MEGGDGLQDAHLDAKTLEHLLSRDQDEAQNRFLLHHLAVCPACRSVGGYLLDLYEEGRIDTEFTPVDVDLALSRRRAPRLWKRLEPHPSDRRRALVRDLSRFQTWGLAEVLCEQSLDDASEDPVAALDLAELALLVAEKVEESGAFHEDWARDLLAYVWAHLGNARRVLTELRSAEEAFRRAEDYWEAGSGGCLPYLPVLQRLRATLFFEQRRFGEAIDLFRAAKEIYRQEGDSHETGKLLVKEARVLEEMGDLPGALDLLTTSESLIDAQREPRLALCVCHNVVLCLANLGRHEEAGALLPEVRELSRELGNHLDLVRLRWMEGRIAEGLGQSAEAEEIFREVRTAFIEQGIGYDVALVSMDLALLLLHQERHAEIRKLAEEMVHLFQSQDVHREALAALALFQQAVCSEKVTLDLVQDIVHFLDRARRQPGLRFEITLPGAKADPE